MSQLETPEPASGTHPAAAPSPDALRALRKDFKARGNIYALSELLFTLLPFIVLLIVTFAKSGEILEIISEGEWSFAAAILFGQTISRLVAGVTHEDRPGETKSENVTLLTTIFIVLGLVPSMTVMTMVLLKSPQVPLWLGASQVFLFAMSVVVFMLLASSMKEAELMGACARKHGLMEWPSI